MMVKHMTEDDFKCKKCNEKYPTRPELEAHKILHLLRFQRRKKLMETILKKVMLLKERSRDH